MTLSEAIKLGIDKVRLPVWANPEAYLQLDLHGGYHGPWMRLYDERTQKAIGAETPQTIFWTDDGNDNWEAFK